MGITVIILTLNEAKHITRALKSVAEFAERCVVIDSGSTDETLALARAAGAEVMEHPFVNQAQQFNWALDQLGPDTGWVFRLDADEIVTPELAVEIRKRIDGLSDNIKGICLARRIFFLGRPIRWGGIFPVHVVRLFRFGHGRCEDRWMDEHILVDGEVIDDLSGEIHDINLNTLSWWITKHNNYASREALEIINIDNKFLERNHNENLNLGLQANLKRILKKYIYNKMPYGIRAFFYFFYRYIIRLGFLDGLEGTAFHVLQGFWYRYLVDIKVHEVRVYMRRNNAAAHEAIREILGIDVDARS